MANGFVNKDYSILFYSILFYIDMFACVQKCIFANMRKQKGFFKDVPAILNWVDSRKY